MGFNLPVLNRRRRLLGTATPIFSPATLFTLSEPGIWLDPSDVANLAWRRNLLTWTEQFDNAAWTKLAVTVTPNAEAAPDGTTTADALLEQTASSNHQASQTVSVAAGVTHTASVYVKANGRTKGSLHCYASTSPFEGFIVDFDLVAKTVTASAVSTGTITASGIQELSNGWFRVYGTGTFSTRTTVLHIARIRDDAGNNSYAGDITKGLFIWGAQLELGSTATEYQRISDVNTEVIERFPFATLYQDPAGTIPVTGPTKSDGTPVTVALALDKSKGLVLGSELVTNGDFSSGTTGWTLGTGWAVTGGQAVATSATGSLTWSGLTLVAGQSYILRYDLTRTAGLITPNLTSSGISRGASGTYTEILVSNSTSASLTFSQFGNFTGTIDNVSLKALPGFHATQATTASRPIYGINPVGGRRNLLTNTNDLTNLTNWPTGSISGMTRSGAGISVDGANNYGYISRTANSVSVVNGVTYVWSVVATSNQTVSNVPLRLAFPSGGIFTTASALVNLQAGVPQRVSFVVVATTTGSGTPEFGVDTRDAVVPGGSNATGYVVTFSDPQFEVGSTATAYQKVTTQYDVTEAGVASVSYLAFDTSKFLVTPTITPGVDKVQVFAGVRKNSDAAGGQLIESSTNSGSNPGTVLISAPPGTLAAYAWRSSGSINADVVSPTTYAAPVTNILTGLGDISGDVSRLRINGTQVGQTLTDQGTGNYLAYPLYIGIRGSGPTLPFNGQLYSLIVRFGTNLTTDTITSTETWVSGKTGFFAPVISGQPTVGVS